MHATEAGAYVADNATVLADVTLGKDANIWFGCVVRGDDAPITIGARTNIQDGTIVHADPGVANHIGSEVTVGHRCILHGARVGDRSLIGMGAILLAGSEIGEECLIAAGAVVKENMRVPPRSLVVGIPGKIVRSITDEEAEGFRASAQGYVDQVRLYL
ncbi:MAG: gamma carbonic anhydrase family protein [Planctomycetes bacterium]|nr:gamma carbonic anhydrase family protein [Planctomycetota bacterium]MCB9910901.1 gamma carbonic anhydrase family protein [Planctomycetota bacterium]MCB9912112.1 gamma carbonic anhydrase family protein [Planctomycetota bacterium]HPF14732.1 gamma carbonic anhydrase family protein [Planctomycetota bacterium]HRV81998.1 gamma carbonic anhydrase family protein [Planctomycetota bacterium]